MISVRDVVGNAHIFNLRRWEENAMSLDLLLQAVPGLFRLLDERGVRYLLVGGVAMLQYVEGRNTEDIDLIMAYSDLETVPELKIVEKNVYFAAANLGALQVDLLLTDNQLFADVLQNHAEVRQFAEQEIPCATVEGLVLLKLYALPSLYRQGRFARVSLYESDIARLLNAYQPDMEPVWTKLKGHLGQSDLASVREIVSEIEARIARFQQFGKE